MVLYNSWVRIAIPVFLSVSTILNCFSLLNFLRADISSLDKLFFMSRVNLDSLLYTSSWNSTHSSLKLKLQNLFFSFDLAKKSSKESLFTEEGPNKWVLFEVNSDAVNKLLLQKSFTIKIFLFKLIISSSKVLMKCLKIFKGEVFRIGTNLHPLFKIFIILSKYFLSKKSMLPILNTLSCTWCIEYSEIISNFFSVNEFFEKEKN